MSNAIEKFEAPAQALAPVSETTAIIHMIERAAANPDVDVEKFARLLEMRERVEAQFARKAFAAAVASAKSKIGPIFKDKGVDFTTSKGRTNYKFEGFDTVARAVDPVLSELGLFYRFRAKQGGGKLRMTCVLSHKDGHEEETTLEGSEDHSGNKNSLQAVGSAATYLQRYTLKCALGLSTSLDDDAQSVSRSEPFSEPDAGPAPTISEKQQTELETLIAETESDTVAFCKRIRVARLSDLHRDDFVTAKKLLTDKAARQKAEKLAQESPNA